MSETDPARQADPSIGIRKDTWNPTQYQRFQDERSRPFFELMALVQIRPEMRVADLGCGTGELTKTLHRHLNARQTLGLDSSPAMLDQAHAHAGVGLRFQAGDIWDFARQSVAPASPAPSEPDGASYDLIFSNAALQWVEDHPALLERLSTRLAEGGQLAVQVPANGDHPSHIAAAAVAREEPFHTALEGHVRIFPILAPEGYASLLDTLGFKQQHVRPQVFGHYLGAREDVIEWVKGTLLTDYQKRLPPDLWTRFLERYRELLLPRLQDSHPFFYPFKRILFWGQK